MKSKRTDEEFLQQLVSLLLAEGIAQLTVAEIARHLSCSRRRLYALAETKEGLFLTGARCLFEGLLQEGNAAITQASGIPDAIASYLDVGVRAAGRLSMAFLADLESSRQGRKLFDDYQMGRSQGLTHLIDEGARQGLFAPRHAQVVAEVMLGAALRIRRPGFLAKSGLTMEEAFHELYELLLNGLLLHKGPAGVDAHPSPSKDKAKEAASSARKRTGRKKVDVPTSTHERDVSDVLLASWNRP